MNENSESVNGFKFLPPKLSAWIKTFIPDRFTGEIPFHKLSKPLNQTRIALVTSAGISLKSDTPFDMEREKTEPEWGDLTYRVIPRGTKATDISVNHLHINLSYILEDINVMLPLKRMEEFEKDGLVGELATSSYSFYGFQWKSLDFLETAIRPMIGQMKKEGTDAALLTPA